MNIEQTKEAIRIMQAFVDGKEIESLCDEVIWERAVNPIWSWNTRLYRIKPTATLRPWTSDEVPLGAWVLEKANRERRWLITDVHDQEFRSDLLKLYEHSTDGGKTWLPCGVVEESK